MDSSPFDGRAVVACDGRVPFDALWAGFVDRAARALAPRLDPSLRDALLTDPNGPLATLLGDLGDIGAPAAFELFALRRPREVSALQVFGGQPGCSVYESFVDDLVASECAALWTAFPALGPMLARRVDDFIAATLELNDRFVADRPAIADRIASARGALGSVRVRSGLSDAHRGGRTVARLSFEHGGEVYYKPRPVDMEEGYAAFVEWFNARRGGLPALRAMVTINCTTHGWMEAAALQPCADRKAAGRYFRRAGALLALADLFCGIDFHGENLVAVGDQPVIVDLETLFHPYGPYERDPDSLDRTELLPRPVSDRSADTYVVCGFGLLPAGAEMRIRQQAWRDVNQDSMAPCERAAGWTTPRGVPRFKDGSTPVAAEWADDVAAGFEEIHRFFLAHRDGLWAPDGPIERAFGGRRTRVVARATRVYARLIRNAVDPRALDGSWRWNALEDRGSANGAHRDLYAAESAALARLEVPYLSGRTDSPLVEADGRTLAGIVARDGLAIARQRAAAVDERAIRTRTALVADRVAAARFAGAASSRDLLTGSVVQGVGRDGSTPFQPQ